MTTDLPATTPERDWGQTLTYAKLNIYPEFPTCRIDLLGIKSLILANVLA